jgi:hypothetical protein
VESWTVEELEAKPAYMSLNIITVLISKGLEWVKGWYSAFPMGKPCGTV